MRHSSGKAKQIKARTPNKRFGVMRGVCSRKVLREFETSFTSSRTQLKTIIHVSKVCRPSEHLRSPARTPSPRPLVVMRATRCSRTMKRRNQR